MVKLKAIVQYAVVSCPVLDYIIQSLLLCLSPAYPHRNACKGNYTHMQCTIVCMCHMSAKTYRHTLQWKQISIWRLIYMHTPTHTYQQQTLEYTLSQESPECFHWCQTTSPHLCLILKVGRFDKVMAWRGSVHVGEPTLGGLQWMLSRWMRNSQQSLELSPSRLWWLREFVIHAYCCERVQMLLIKMS